LASRRAPQDPEAACAAYRARPARLRAPAPARSPERGRETPVHSDPTHPRPVDPGQAPGRGVPFLLAGPRAPPPDPAGARPVASARSRTPRSAGSPLPNETGRPSRPGPRRPRGPAPGRPADRPPRRPARGVRGALVGDARADGWGRSFGPRKLPRAAPGRASGPAYRGRRASATALVHNLRASHTADRPRGLGWKRPVAALPASKESPWPSRPTPSPRTSPS
jgi:hypothetical protein